MASREYNMLQRVFACILLAAACASNLLAHGQSLGQPQIITQQQLTVRVTFEDDRSVPPNFRVELLSAYGSSVDSRETDTSGTVRFSRLDPAKYKLRITGTGIVTTDSREIDLTTSGPNVTEYVRVRRDPSLTVDARELPTVDASIPPEARKEFDKASDKMEHKNWTEAKTHLDRAISIYPKYALAHNNLAMVYANLNQGEKAVDSFRTAAGLDEHIQQANLYLGHFYYDNKNYKQAEPYLLRAAGSEPRNPQLLLALANTQLRNGEAEQALANAQKVHSVPDHKKFALAHLIAAQILTDRGDNQRSREEFELFLREAPDSPMAPRVKDALAKIDTGSK
jgi:Tfp pilus assembly protein PilF